MRIIPIVLCIVIFALAGGTGVMVWHIVTAEETPEAELSFFSTNVPLSVAHSPVADAPSLSLDAASAVLWDTKEQVIRYKHNAFEQRPIASLTKLMTAMVALDHHMDLDAAANIELNEYGPGGNLLLHPGELVTNKDLLYASLIGSANNATKAYVRNLGIDPKEFVADMNRKAIALGLEQTHFTEVSGLDPRNVSTAYDVARMAEIVFSQYPEIARASSMAEYSFVVGNSGRGHTIRNTNKLISEQGQPARGSKTGYLDEALYCMVMQSGDPETYLMSVILGSPSEQSNLLNTQILLTTKL